MRDVEYLGSIPSELNAPLPDPLPPHAPGTIFVRPHYAHVDLDVRGATSITVSPGWIHGNVAYGTKPVTKILIEGGIRYNNRVEYIQVLPPLSTEELKAERDRKIQWVDRMLTGG